MAALKTVAPADRTDGRADRRPNLCGAVRCGAVRCGAVRCGAVRCGAVRCGAVRCGAVRCGAVRCGAVRSFYLPSGYWSRSRMVRFVGRPSSFYYGSLRPVKRPEQKNQAPAPKTQECDYVFTWITFTSYYAAVPEPVQELAHRHDLDAVDDARGRFGAHHDAPRPGCLLGDAVQAGQVAAGNGAGRLDLDRPASPTTKSTSDPSAVRQRKVGRRTKAPAPCGFPAAG